MDSTDLQDLQPVFVQRPKNDVGLDHFDKKEVNKIKKMEQKSEANLSENGHVTVSENDQIDQIFE